MKEYEEFFKFSKDSYNKILKKLGKKESDGMHYVAQISDDESKAGVHFALQISGVGEGVAPLTFVNPSFETLKTEVEMFIDEKITDKDVEIVYHQAQIKACKDTIEYHEKAIQNVIAVQDEEAKENMGEKDA